MDDEGGRTTEEEVLLRLKMDNFLLINDSRPVVLHPRKTDPEELSRSRENRFMINSRKLPIIVACD